MSENIHITKSDKEREQELRALAGMLGNLEDEPAPMDLLPRIMSRIEPKKASPLQRFMHWLTEPKTLAIRPVLAAPLAAAAVALLILTFQLPTGQQNSGQVAAINGRREVVFVLEQPQAQSVSLVGSFNGWTPQGYEMQYDKTKNVWRLNVPLPPGTHTYGFLVDGQVLADPSAVLYEDDGFGNKNSMLLVGGSHEHAI